MGLVSAVKHRSARAIRRALLRGIGAVFVAIGAGFLTSAAWITLATVYSPLFAALTLAGVFLGIGLIILGIASGGKDHYPHPEADPLRDPASTPPEGKMSPLAEAFIIGLNVAHEMRRRR